MKNVFLQSWINVIYFKQNFNEESEYVILFLALEIVRMIYRQQHDVCVFFRFFF